MLSEESHLSDQELLLAVDGELSAREAGRVQSHLAACWACRARKQEIEAAIGEFVRLHQQNFDAQIPPADGPRALLKAQLLNWRSSADGTSGYLGFVARRAAAFGSRRDHLLRFLTLGRATSPRARWPSRFLIPASLPAPPFF